MNLVSSVSLISSPQCLSPRLIFFFNFPRREDQSFVCFYLAHKSVYTIISGLTKKSLVVKWQLNLVYWYGLFNFISWMICKLAAKKNDNIDQFALYNRMMYVFSNKRKTFQKCFKNYSCHNSCVAGRILITSDNHW